MKNRRLRHYVMICILFLCAVFCIHGFVQAAEKDITVKDGERQTVSVCIGDTGRIIPDAGDLEVAYFEFSAISDSQYLEVDQDGNYTVNGLGYVSVGVYGYDAEGYNIFWGWVDFDVNFDMTNVTLKQSSVTEYLMPEYYDEEPYYSEFDETNIIIDIESEESLPDDTDVEVTSSNSAYNVDDAKIDDNKIYITLYGTKSGTSVLTIVIEDKTFTVNLHMKRVGISETSLMLAKKKSKTLKVTGYTGEVTWTSLNDKIATVSAKGKVTGKKYGNTVIIAKLGDKYIGCAVSIIPAKLKKVCARAEYIGEHWKYSQAKRTQNGYYDCSALVWKAYKKYTSIRFGSPNYPGTSASESAWCKKNKRVLKGSFKYSMISKMQMRPGDIVFKSKSKKKKYSTTYHVEMMTGYRCARVDSNGQPEIVCRWGARGSEYGIWDGYIVARPMKY